jgi:ubiquinone/menaquinone biosynthesis C-methylase UbiE
MTYQPELYDVVTAPTMQNDVEWYCRQAQQSGGPVLELGAGTGRVTLAIAAAGVAIHALDSDTSMLERLRSKLSAAPADVQARTSVVAGDMRTFDLAERFALIICPFRTFLHNVTEADQLACLARVRHHLRPSGRFAFNVFHPSLTFMSQHAGPLAGVWRWTGNHALPSGGWVVQSEAIRYDTVGQAVHALHRYDVFGATGALERSSVLRLQLAYLYPSEIRRLLETAGFTSITISGGFDGREFTHEGQELVVEAQRDA